MRVNELLQKTDLPEGQVGLHRIMKFTVTKEKAQNHLLQSIMSGHGRHCPEGDYTKLVRLRNLEKDCKQGELVMSDTPDELRDHHDPVLNAKGHCLINGLGLAVVAEACLRKSEVEKVTVVEISAEVIELVGTAMKEKWGDRLEIIEADCLTYMPPKGERYGMVWHDIWDTISSDNLPDMCKLHRKYGRRADWQGSWTRWHCEKQRREDRSFSWRW